MAYCGCGAAGFRYGEYHYWFSVPDACYYKQKIGSFDNEEISKEENEVVSEEKYKETII